MIFSKLCCFINTYRCTTFVVRRYANHNFRPLMMPKDNKLHLMELQKQRKKIRSQASKYPPSHIYLQVIGHGTRAESRSVMLVTDHTNYLFNCGEGTQRLASEHRIRLTKIENVFVTGTTWNNMGGLPGVALTIQETGVPKVNLHGPEGTTDILKAIDNFVTLNSLQLAEADISRQFEDHTMTVTYVPIKDPRAGENKETIDPIIFLKEINYYDYHKNINGKRPLSPVTMKKEAQARSLYDSPKSKVDSMMIYVCKVHHKAGTLNFERCVDLGVPPGPLLARLKAGNDITLPDGIVVKSVDCTSPPEPGPLFIVMECPDEEWMKAIVENPIFIKYQEGTAASSELVADYIVHFTPTKILNNPIYIEWMKKFGSDTKHLIVNEDNTGYSSEASHRMQHQLHLIHPTIFPFFENQQNFVSLEENAKKQAPLDAQATGLDLHRCQTLNLIHLRPNKGVYKESEVKLEPRAYVQEILDIDGFSDSLAELQTEVNAKTKSLGDTAEYPKLLMLGTGSSVPNKIRNTSGMLLQLDEERSIILDCGEGTAGQIIRFFGESEADRILKSIKAVYVSHLHADHHLGFIGLLQQRQRVTDEPVFLLAPQQICSYLHFYSVRFEPILKQFNLVSNRDMLSGQAILSPQTANKLHETLDIANINTSFVTHCPFAYAIAITLKDGRKICYSGDTVPCDNMQRLAKDCFLLIHEATMEDGLENDALQKHHSTISQAINVGVKANANFTLLTHFSQRYSKIPMLPNKKQSNIDFSRVGIAFDFMQISLSQLSLLPLFYPSLEIMFSDFRAMLDERAQKREWRKEQVKEALN